MSSVFLAWTVPGDDGFLGQAYLRDICYITNTASASDWRRAYKLPVVPTPKMSGAPDTLLVSGGNVCSGNSYLFRVEASCPIVFNISP